MTRFRSISTGFLLCISLLLTGQAVAMARGMAAPHTQMVLCTGHGPVMVYMDEAGAPTGPPVLCPDGALHLLQMTADAPAPAYTPLECCVAARGLVSLPPLISLHQASRARDPPATG